MSNKETIKTRAENFVINMRIFNEFLFELHIQIIKILLLKKLECQTDGYYNHTCTLKSVVSLRLS